AAAQQGEEPRLRRARRGHLRRPQVVARAPERAGLPHAVERAAPRRARRRGSWSIRRSTRSSWSMSRRGPSLLRLVAAIALADTAWLACESGRARREPAFARATSSAGLGAAVSPAWT